MSKTDSSFTSLLINCMIILTFTLFIYDLGMLIFVKCNFASGLLWVFFLTFYIEIISDLEKRYKNDKKNSFISFIQIVQMLTFDHICFIILILSLLCYIYTCKFLSVLLIRYRHTLHLIQCVFPLQLIQCVFPSKQG